MEKRETRARSAPRGQRERHQNRGEAIFARSRAINMIPVGRAAREKNSRPIHPQSARRLYNQSEEALRRGIPESIPMYRIRFVKNPVAGNTEIIQERESRQSGSSTAGCRRLNAPISRRKTSR
jgi:hypothetical protein